MQSASLRQAMEVTVQKAGIMSIEVQLNKAMMSALLPQSVESFLQAKLKLIKSGEPVFKINDFTGGGVIVSGVTHEKLNILYAIAEQHHQGMDSDDPARTTYMAHILGVVAFYVNSLRGENPYAIMAGFLHDVIEDSIEYFTDDINKKDSPEQRRRDRRNITITDNERQKVGESIKEALINSSKFNENEVDQIMRYVWAMTKTDIKRKAKSYYKEIVQAGEDAVLLKMADRMYNIGKVYRDPEFIGQYIGETIKEFTQMPVTESGGSFISSQTFERQQIFNDYLSQRKASIGQVQVGSLNVDRSIQAMTQEVEINQVINDWSKGIGATLSIRTERGSVFEFRHAVGDGAERGQHRIEVYLNNEQVGYIHFQLVKNGTVGEIEFAFHEHSLNDLQKRKEAIFVIESARFDAQRYKGIGRTLLGLAERMSAKLGALQFLAKTIAMHKFTSFYEKSGYEISSYHQSSVNVRKMFLNDSMFSKIAIEDQAQVGQEAKKGGIDFNPSKMRVEVKGDDQGIQFHVDPAMIKQFQDAPGFVPVIINIQPVSDLRVFLELKEPSVSRHI